MRYSQFLRPVHSFLNVDATTIRLSGFQLSLDRVHQMSETIKIPQRKQFLCEDLRIKN